MIVYFFPLLRQIIDESTLFLVMVFEQQMNLKVSNESNLKGPKIGVLILYIKMKISSFQRELIVEFPLQIDWVTENMKPIQIKAEATHSD